MLHQTHPLLAGGLLEERAARLRREADEYRLASGTGKRDTLWGRLALRRSLRRRAGPSVPRQVRRRAALP